MHRLPFVASLLVTLAIGHAAIGDATGRPPVREFKSMWDPAPATERMWFAEDFASFSFLRGHMLLAYAGTMSAKNDKADAAVKIYRIVNAEEFFRLNKGNNEYLCQKNPTLWLGISYQDAPDNPNIGDVRVNFYDIADYRDYRDDKTGMCASYPYRLIPGH